MNYVIAIQGDAKSFVQEVHNAAGQAEEFDDVLSRISDGALRFAENMGGPQMRNSLGRVTNGIEETKDALNSMGVTTTEQFQKQINKIEALTDIWSEEEMVVGQLNMRKKQLLQTMQQVAAATSEEAQQQQRLNAVGVTTEKEIRDQIQTFQRLKQEVEETSIEYHQLSERQHALQRQMRDLKDRSKAAARGQQYFGNASGSASFAVLSLSRIVQDAQYGFIGMANNVTQSTESVVALTSKTQGLQGALSQMGKTLKGPMGIIAGMSVLMGIGPTILKWIRGTGEAAEEATDQLDHYSSALDSLIKVAGDVPELQERSVAELKQARAQVDAQVKGHEALVEQIKYRLDLQRSSVGQANALNAAGMIGSMIWNRHADELEKVNEELKEAEARHDALNRKIQEREKTMEAIADLTKLGFRNAKNMAEAIEGISFSNLDYEQLKRASSELISASIAFSGQTGMNEFFLELHKNVSDELSEQQNLHETINKLRESGFDWLADILEGVEKEKTMLELALEKREELLKVEEQLKGPGGDRLIRLRAENAELERQTEFYEEMKGFLMGFDQTLGPGFVEPLKEQTEKLQEIQIDWQQEQFEFYTRLGEVYEDTADRHARMLDNMDMSQKEWLTTTVEGLTMLEDVSQVTLGGFADLARGVFEASGESAMGFFNTWKAIAIADATVSAYAATNKALNSAPPPFNYALAAGTAAAGMANVASIISTSPGNKGGSPSTGGGGASTYYGTQFTKEYWRRTGEMPTGTRDLPEGTSGVRGSISQLARSVDQLAMNGVKGTLKTERGAFVAEIEDSGYRAEVEGF